MLGSGGLADAKQATKVADTEFRQRQGRQDPQARRVSQGTEPFRLHMGAFFVGKHGLECRKLGPMNHPRLASALFPFGHNSHLRHPIHAHIRI